MENGKSLAKQEANDIRLFLEGRQKQIESVIVSSLGGSDRLLALVFQAINATPSLLKCTKASLFVAIMNCAALGLEPNTVKQHAFIIPYKDKANFQIGSRGWTALARRSNSEVCHIVPTVVYEGDKFKEVRGTNPEIEHEPQYKSKDIVKAYAVAYMMVDNKLVPYDFEVVTKDMINAAKSQNQAIKAGKTSLMWSKFEGEGAKKFVSMRLCKRLDLDAPMAAAIALDNAAESGKPQGIFDPELGGIVVDPTEIKDEPDKSSEKTVQEAIEKTKEKAGQANTTESKPEKSNTESEKSDDAQDASNGTTGAKAEFKLHIYDCGCEFRKDPTKPADPKCLDHPEGLHINTKFITTDDEIEN